MSAPVIYTRGAGNLVVSQHGIVTDAFSSEIAEQIIREHNAHAELVEIARDALRALNTTRGFLYTDGTGDTRARSYALCTRIERALKGVRS